ncbi:sulfate reduction electron transfer complex DsrMKJOP subunit DsrJ [Planctomycetota bacterium]
MGDLGKIIAGLFIFVILAAFPIWYAVGFGEDAPPPKRGPANDGSFCIEANMVAKHMDLLAQWRNDVVRDNDREPYEPDGHEPCEKSLTKTCMKCHNIKPPRDNGIISCSECHDYANVELSCWDCHVDVKGN